LDVLLAALDRAGDPPFMIAGDGPLRRALEDLAGRLGLVNTMFLGWQSPQQSRELVAAARYVAIPSIGEETANLAALEALSAARPLLVSQRGALPELVASGAGLACRPGDDMDLSEKISLLMKDDALCRRASAEAAEFARRWLDSKFHLSELVSLYRELSTNEVG
jgi:glycosyltransferase involved in cell wall biosynthesis